MSFSSLAKSFPVFSTEDPGAAVTLNSRRPWSVLGRKSVPSWVARAMELAKIAAAVSTTFHRLARATLRKRA